MISDRQKKMDQKLEIIIGYTLRIGVVTAAIIVLIGGVLYLIQNHSEVTHYHTFHSAASRTDNISGIVRNIRELNMLGIIQLGLLVLIATPLLRVIFSVIVFVLENDVLYAAATLIVLIVLLYSFFIRGM